LTHMTRTTSDLDILHMHGKQGDKFLTQPVLWPTKIRVVRNRQNNIVF
jgi:hypothetical protein